MSKRYVPVLVQSLCCGITRQLDDPEGSRHCSIPHEHVEQVLYVRGERADD